MVGHGQNEKLGQRSEWLITGAFGCVEPRSGIQRCSLSLPALSHPVGEWEVVPAQEEEVAAGRTGYVAAPEDGRCPVQGFNERMVRGILFLGEREELYLCAKQISGRGFGPAMVWSR